MSIKVYFIHCQRSTIVTIYLKMSIKVYFIHYQRYGAVTVPTLQSSVEQIQYTPFSGLVLTSVSKL
jgi:hypothetical protein